MQDNTVCVGIVGERLLFTIYSICKVGGGLWYLKSVILNGTTGLILAFN